MNKPSIILRPAVATFDEGLMCAHFANEASEGFMQVLYGRCYPEIMAKAFLQPGHDMSYQNVTFAVYDDDIVGMILAYTEAQHRASSIEPQRQAAGPWRLRMRMIELFMGPLMRLNDSIESGDYYLHFIAVDQAKRVGGIGTVLLEEFERQARASGSSRLSLDVSTKNEVAQRFYKNRGWAVDFAWPNRWFMPSVSLRMTKRLE